jgi:prevent-host-death family protein
MEVGIRELRRNLSGYLAKVSEGDEVIVTDRGTAVAKILSISGDRAGDRAFDRAVADGLVTPASHRERSRPARRVKSSANVSDLVGDQRR